MKSPPRARSPTLLRILLYSGFGTKCGAPHFAPLLPNTQDQNPAGANNPNEAYRVGHGASHTIGECG